MSGTNEAPHACPVCGRGKWSDEGLCGACTSELEAARVEDAEDEAEEVAADEALAQRASIRGLVAAYEDACAAIRTAFGMIVEAERRLNATYTLGDYRSIHIKSSRHSHSDNFESPEECVEAVRRQCWETIVERLELRRILSVKRWEELQKQLREGELPEITEQSVAAFARGYLDTMGQMLTEAVGEVYEWLRPREDSFAGSYKTNGQFDLGGRVVLTWMVERSYSGGYHIRYGRAQQQLTALENVFSALDGKGSTSKSHYSQIENAVRESKDGRAETEYFRARAFKNGNLHLEFVRPDLVARFNQIAGGRRLKTTEAA